MNIIRVFYFIVIIEMVSGSPSCHAMDSFCNATTLNTTYCLSNCSTTDNEFNSTDGDHVNISTFVLMVCIGLRFINPVRTVLSLCMSKES